MKRFYKDVGVRDVTGGWQVTLDGRDLKTVQGAGQIVPSRALAEMLAAEWQAQGETLDPATFPARDLVDYALDIIARDPAEKADGVVAYGDTDTLLYRADPQDALYARQHEVWEPILTAFEAREGIRFTRVSGIMHRPQSDDTLARLRSRLSGFNPIALAGVEMMSSLAASLIIALSACEADADAAALWDAVCLEENWQADLWGHDAEAEDRRIVRKESFLKTVEVTRCALAA